jgi:hypothetical protein
VIAPPGHGVTSVEREVEENLLHLTLIRAHPPQVGREIQHEYLVLPEHPAQHVLHAADQGVDIEHLRAEQLAAAEREELLRNRGGTLSGPIDLSHFTREGVIPKPLKH